MAVCMCQALRTVLEKHKSTHDTGRPLAQTPSYGDRHQVSSFPDRTLDISLVVMASIETLVARYFSTFQAEGPCAGFRPSRRTSTTSQLP